LYGEEVLRSDIDSAYSCGKIALNEALKLQDEKLIIEAHLLIGYAHEANAKYKDALDSFLKASELSSKTKNKIKLAQCYTAMGVVYWYQGFYDKAEEYYKKNIELCIELKDIGGLGASYGNLAILLDDKGDIDDALFYYKKALAIFDTGKKPIQTAACLDNMSIVYKQKKDFKNALEHNLRSYKIRESINDSIGMLASMGNLGSIFIAQNKVDDAIAISEKVLEIATRLGAKEDVKSAYYNLKDAYELKKDYKSANVIINKLMDLKDSLRGAENANQIAELEAKFKNKEKETELSEMKLVQQLKEKENAERLKRKNYFIIVLSIIGVFVLIVAVLLLKRFKEKKEIAEKFAIKNHEIEKQNSIIDRAFHELSEKNKDITDSIKYARRIQEAILPPKEVFTKALNNSFVFFKPKDIVSGDFYWLEEYDGNVYFAVVDCTGHGVPGAFMSIVGYNLLKKAIHQNKCNTPADILNQINVDLNETLRQTFEESSIKDGMEVSLCKWDRTNNELLFSGANTIVYKIEDSKLEIIKGDKHPVGSFYGEALKPFSNIKIEYKPSTILYLFSDGYADQFGGDKGKKYKYKQLEEFLQNSSNLSMEQQHVALAKEFEEWRGNLEQVDDVCVIGVKF